MKLLFVYNADSNLIALISGTVRKLASPDTYPCKLCALTHPLASMDKKWKKFVESLPYPAEFLHRDEFVKQYPDKAAAKLPAVFAEDASGVRLLVSSEKIDGANSLPGLMEIVTSSMSGAKGHKILYQCPECGLHYADEKIAKVCETWCRTNKSCNLDIIKHAVEK